MRDLPEKGLTINIWAVAWAAVAPASNGILFEAKLNFWSARANSRGFFETLEPVCFWPAPLRTDPKKYAKTITH